MKTLIPAILLSSILSLPVLAEVNTNESAQSLSSHNQHHASQEVVSSDDTKGNMMNMGMMDNMESHQKMMTQMHQMMSQMMSEEQCLEMMKSMGEKQT